MTHTKAQVAARLPVRRGLTEEEAAIYVGGLCPAKFRQLVADGRMPRPRLIGRRRVYDVDELDAAFKTLPREDGDTADTWEDFRDNDQARAH